MRTQALKHRDTENCSALRAIATSDRRLARGPPLKSSTPSVNENAGETSTSWRPTYRCSSLLGDQGRYSLINKQRLPQSEHLAPSQQAATPTDSQQDVLGNEYPYVDTAVFGVRNRNNVQRLNGFSPPSHAYDCYRTWHRFPAALLDYVQENRSPSTGKPSVAGYPGPAWAEFLPFDFDDGRDPAKAVAEAAHFVRHWEKEWGLSPEALRIYWSGMKGISIEIPAALFGGFEPGTDIAKQLKALAKGMTPNAETLDTSIYEKMRLWRVPNTKHGGSELYKVRLNVKELLDGHC
jgi:hypothetical protein